MGLQRQTPREGQQRYRQRISFCSSVGSKFCAILEYRKNGARLSVMLLLLLLASGSADDMGRNHSFYTFHATALSFIFEDCLEDC